MTAIFIDPTVKAQLTQMRDRADKRKNWFDTTDPGRKRVPPGDRPGHKVELPSGEPGVIWTVVYSVDVDPELGPVKHMSMRLNGKLGRAPNPAAMQFIADELGLGAADYMGPTPGDDAIHYIVIMTEKGKTAFNKRKEGLH